MKNEKFQALPDSHKLLLLFETEWGRLNDSQREDLAEVINETYLSFKDELSCFVLSEVLGEYLANDKSLKVFDNLQQTKNEAARSFVAYGYGKLALTTQNENIKKIAVNELNKLKNDNSELVRNEAIIGLNKMSEKN